jgi:hypothetical protein
VPGRAAIRAAGPDSHRSAASVGVGDDGADPVSEMYPADTTIAVVSADTGPNALPMNVMNDPVDGTDLENSASVLPSRATAIPAATMVSGEATPAVAASSANPK